MNKYLRRIVQLRVGVQRWLDSADRADTKMSLIYQAQEDLDYVSDEAHRCLYDRDTLYCYTRKELDEFNRLYNLYKL